MGKEGYANLKTSQVNENCSSIIRDNEVNEKSKIKRTIVTLDDNDYILTNLNISRELGFIVGLALNDNSKNIKLKRPVQNNSYLFAYNLKGNLIKYIDINVNLKEKDNIMLQTTRDGEYIILTENSNTIKLLRTFDLTPLYAFNTSEPSAGNLQPEKIRSLSLVDFKYFLVGLENGKLLVYNIDFNRWNHESFTNRF